MDDGTRQSQIIKGQRSVERILFGPTLGFSYIQITISPLYYVNINTTTDMSSEIILSNTYRFLSKKLN